MGKTFTYKKSKSITIMTPSASILVFVWHTAEHLLGAAWHPLATGGVVNEGDRLPPGSGPVATPTSKQEASRAHRHRAISRRLCGASWERRPRSPASDGGGEPTSGQSSGKGCCVSHVPTHNNRNGSHSLYLQDTF